MFRGDAYIRAALRAAAKLMFSCAKLAKDQYTNFQESE